MHADEVLNLLATAVRNVGPVPCESAPDIYFSDSVAVSRQAAKLCYSCHVRKICLDYAMRSGESFGVWGGMTTSERRQALPEYAAEHA